MSAPQNPPAFACAADGGHQAGMSLRDWFAGQALAGLCANPSTPDMMIGKGYAGSKLWAAQWAYDYADAMLAAREQRA